MTANQIVTTRAGRKIRHIDPNAVPAIRGLPIASVVDDATGLEIEKYNGLWRIMIGHRWPGGPWMHSWMYCDDLESCLHEIDRAEAVCTLVRYLVLSWKEAS